MRKCRRKIAQTKEKSSKFLWFFTKNLTYDTFSDVRGIKKWLGDLDSNQD